jgi:hypothetical protein
MMRAAVRVIAAAWGGREREGGREGVCVCGREEGVRVSL